MEAGVMRFEIAGGVYRRRSEGGVQSPERI